jgi:hypothetical protein
MGESPNQSVGQVGRMFVEPKDKELSDSSKGISQQKELPIGESTN